MHKWQVQAFNNRGAASVLDMVIDTLQWIASPLIYLFAARNKCVVRSARTRVTAVAKTLVVSATELV